MQFKNASNYNPSVEYIDSLVVAITEKFTITVAQISAQIGVGQSTIRKWRAGQARPDYPSQLALEILLAADSIVVRGSMGWEKQNNRLSFKDGDVIKSK